jgi:hypothetical protein
MRVALLLLAVLLVGARPVLSYTVLEQVLINFFQPLTPSDATVPHALMYANARCPCLTEIGCIQQVPPVISTTAEPWLGEDTILPPIPGPGINGTDTLYYAFIYMFSARSDVRDISASSAYTLGATSSCIDLANASSVAAGCGTGTAVFGTAECGACTGAGLTWCPAVQVPGTTVELPATCFDAAATQRVLPAQHPFDVPALGGGASAYGTEAAFGLARTRLLSFAASQGGCPFSGADAPVSTPASCPAEPACVECVLPPVMPGGTCTCAVDGCCTESFNFWKAADPWPAACAPNFTRATPFWPGGVTMAGALSLSSRGDKCVLLARAWISATLSVCGRGACTDATTDAALATAETYLFDVSKCPGALSKADNEQVRDATSVLNNYVAGLIGPGPCDATAAAIQTEQQAGPAGTTVAAGAESTANNQEGLLIAILVIVVSLCLCVMCALFVRIRRRR